MAAIYAKEKDNRVIVLEKNEKIGKKIYITGKGRCNITNIADYEDYFSNIVSNKNFLRGALKQFPPEKMIKLLNDNGLSTKVERGGRVFPQSDKSNDVIKTFEKILKQKGVEIRYNQSVMAFSVRNSRIQKIITQDNEYYPDKVILATGGKSYKATGSDGKGYELAKEWGHTIIPLKPSLVSILSDFCLDESGNRVALKDMPSLQGLSLKNVQINVIDANDKVLFKEFGEALFTHNGLSGPVILTLSSKINRMDLRQLRLSIDLKPALDNKTLDRRLIRDFEHNSNKIFQNCLKDLLPTKLIPFIIKLSQIPPETVVHSVTKEQRKALGWLLKNLRFEISDLDDINNAVVTAGGVCVKEIDPKTMKSKLIENLYFAGEIIDVDALTGGYNLQIAFATGCVAGSNAKKEEKK